MTNSLDLKVQAGLEAGWARMRAMQSTLKTLTVEEACYIAGFFDGEGSIDCRTAARGRYTRKYYTLLIGQVRPEVLYWIQSCLGAGSVKKRIRDQRVIYRYRLQGRLKVTHLLEQLLPYLIVKRDEAIRVTAGKRARKIDPEETQG